MELRAAVLVTAVLVGSPARAVTGAPIGPVGGPDALSTVSQRHLVRVAPPGRAATHLLAVQNGGVPPRGTTSSLSWWRSDDEGTTWTPYRTILATSDHMVTDLLTVGADVAAVYSYDTTTTTFPLDSGRDPQRSVHFQWWRHDGAGDWNAGPLVTIAAPPAGQAYHRATVARDSLGRIWVQAWLRDACSSCGDTARLWVSTDGGGSFVRQPDLGRVTSLGGGRLISLGARLAFLWNDYSWDNPARLRVRDDAASLATWGAAVNAFPDGDTIYHGASIGAVQDGRGGLHVVYKARTEDLFYRHFDGTAFGPRTRVDAPGDWALQMAITAQDDDLFICTTHVTVPNAVGEVRLYQLSRGFGTFRVLDDAPDFKGYPTAPEALPPGAPLVCAFGQGWWGAAKVVAGRALPAAPARDYALSTAPGAVTDDGTSTVTATPVSGYAGTVALTVTGVPAGASATLGAASLGVGPGAASTTLTLSAGTAAAGTYALTVSGVDGSGLRRSAQVSYTVRPRTVPDFTVALSPSSLADAGTATATVTPLSGFAGTVTLVVSGIPAGATATLGGSSVAVGPGPASTTLSLAPGAAAAGTSTVRVTASGGGLTRVAQLTYTVSPRVAPDYTLALTPGAVTDAGVATVTLGTVGGYAGTVQLTVTGVPAGASATLGASSVAVGPGSGTTTLTLARGSAAGGTSVVTVSGVDGSGLRHSASLSYTVTAAGTTPAIASLTDAFTGPGVSSQWTVQPVTAGSTASASGGVLTLAPQQASGFTGVFVKSARTWRLTGSSAHVQVVGTVARGSANQKFRVQGPAPMDWSDTLGFWLESGVLYAFYTVNGAESFVATASFSATTHAWWQVRESAGTLLWETSPDGRSWTRLASVPASTLRFSPDQVDLVFDAISFGSGATSPGQARFTNLDQ